MSLVLGRNLGWACEEKKWFLQNKDGTFQYFLKLEELFTDVGKRLEKIRLDQEYSFKYQERHIEEIYL